MGPVGIVRVVDMVAASTPCSKQGPVVLTVKWCNFSRSLFPRPRKDVTAGAVSPPVAVQLFFFGHRIFIEQIVTQWEKTLCKMLLCHSHRTHLSAVLEKDTLL